MSLNSSSRKPILPYRKSTYITGAVLIAVGIMVLLSQYLKTTWLTLMFIPAVGLILMMIGIYIRKFGLLIGGSLVGFTGLGAVFSVSSLNFLPVLPKIGVLVLGLSAGWFAITFLSVFIHHRIIWWPLVPAGTVGAVGIVLAVTQMNLLDFVFWLGIGTGVPLLIWGIFSHIFGLIIPGCIVTTIGLGISMAWQVSGEVNSLAQTGVMLVWFAVGWGLITVFSRAFSQNFLWWPLIPGGVLFMVGWGLYIGGNPDNADNFIRNTGSVALIIFGIYLVLIKKSIQQ